jgi:hypothetical protein
VISSKARRRHGQRIIEFKIVQHHIRQHISHALVVAHVVQHAMEVAPESLDQLEVFELDM